MHNRVVIICVSKDEVIDFIRDKALHIEKEIKKEVTVYSTTFPITVLMLSSSQPITTTITKAFNPIVDVIQGIAYPMTFIMMSSGALLMILGNKRKGLEFIKESAKGYLLLQFLPFIMRLLQQVADQLLKGLAK